MVYNINPIENSIGQRVLPVQEPMMSKEVQSTEVITPPQGSVPFGQKEQKPTTTATPKSGNNTTQPVIPKGMTPQTQTSIEMPKDSQNPPTTESGMVSQNPPSIERPRVSENPPAIERGQLSQQPPSIERDEENMKTADLAFTAVNKAIERGQKINEEDKEIIISRLAETRGLDVNEVRALFDQKMQGSQFSGVDEMSEKVDRDVETVNTLTNKLTPEQLLTVANSNTLPPEIKSKLTQTPQYIEALNKQKEKNEAQVTNDIVSGEKSKSQKPEVDTKELEKTLTQGYDVGKDIKDKISSLSQDSDLNVVSGEIGDIDQEIILLQSQIEGIKDKVVEELGQTTTKSALQAIIYDRQSDLQERLNTKISMREAKQAQYNRIKQEKELEIQRQIQQQQQTMGFLNANNGLALLGTTQKELKQLEANGMIPMGYADLYGNMTESMIGSTLSQLGPLNEKDVNDIKTMLASGQSPQDILSVKLSEPRFQQKVQDPNLGKVVKSGDTSFQYNPQTGLYDIPVGAGTAQNGGQAFYGEGQKTGDVMQDFAMFFNKYNDYEGNTGIDYPVSRGTAIPAPTDLTITSIQRHNDGNIRVQGQLATGEKVNFDHLDPQTLAHLGVEGLSKGKSVSVNKEIPMGQYMGFVGNTGNVRTTLGGSLEKSRTPTQAEREAGRGAHLSFEVYDPQTGKAIPVEQAYKRIQENIMQEYERNNRNFSGYENIFIDYLENGKEPSKNELEAMGMDFTTFFEKAPEVYLSAKKEDWAEKGFDVTNAGALSRADQKLMRDLEVSIGHSNSIAQSFDALIKMVDEYGGERIPSHARDTMSSLYQDILLQGKEVYKLGVLNGPDLVIMESILGPNPTERGTILRSSKAIKKNFEKVKDRFIKNIDIKAQGYGLKYNPDAVKQKQMEEQQQQQKIQIQQNLLDLQNFKLTNLGMHGAMPSNEEQTVGQGTMMQQ